MKVKLYMRVAKQRSGFKAAVVTRKASTSPLFDSNARALPTIAFALELDVPDGMFRQAEQVIAALKVPESAAVIAADVKVIE